MEKNTRDRRKSKFSAPVIEIDNDDSFIKVKKGKIQRVNYLDGKESNSDNNINTRNEGKEDILILNRNILNTKESNSNKSNRPLISDISADSKIEEEKVEIEDLTSREFLNYKKRMTFVSSLRKKLTNAEIQENTEQYFVKIQTDELLCFLLILLSIASSIIYFEINYQLRIIEKEMPYRNFALNLSLALVTISNILFSKLIILIYKLLQHPLSIVITSSYINQLSIY